MDPTSPQYKKGHLALVWGTERAQSLAGGGTRWRAGQAAPSTLGLGPHRTFVYWYLEQEWEGGRGAGGQKWWQWGQAWTVVSALGTPRSSPDQPVGEACTPKWLPEYWRIDWMF